MHNLRILQANLQKSKTAHQSILNDDNLHLYSLLLLQEPYCHSQVGTVYMAEANRRHWNLYCPSSISDSRYPYRSVIWANNHLQTTQIVLPSSDITAIQITTPSDFVLVFSVYVPPTSFSQHPDQELLHRIEVITTAIRTQRARHPHRDFEIVIAGDFNRHDVLWGGPSVGNTHGEGQPILDLMIEFDLQSLLPIGRLTWESPGRDAATTIDLVLASPRLTDCKMQCDLSPTRHGSDHRAIDTSFALDLLDIQDEPCYNFDKAPWEEIRAVVKTRLFPVNMHDDVDQFAYQFTRMVVGVLDERVPKRKPSPYAKRWWTQDLSRLRKEYTILKNRASRYRRAGWRNHILEAMAHDARNAFFNAVTDQKTNHWLQFLQDADSIWKAAAYLKTGSSSPFAKVPALRKGDTMIETDEGIASELLSSFFPPLRSITTLAEPPRPYSQLPFSPLTMEEIDNAIRRADPHKAPGNDTLPMRVWKELWPVVKHHLLRLFQLSIWQGRLPKQWKVARIVPFRKSVDRDNTLCSSYRPISLLPTISKILEAVVAERISFLVEEMNLLPKNHFGARKARSTEQALAILQENILRAWREKKVLSLVSFDIKGAYNGVCKEALLRRLRERQIPETLVVWIDNFCSQRYATLTVNSYTSPESLINQPGLPQGSPLSPILFLFFNANLVQRIPILKDRGSMAFVDDYTAWIIGDSEDGNAATIQSGIIPFVELWAASSGASFNPGKTAFIHFSRKTHMFLPQRPISMQGITTPPSDCVKILGVLMDRKLNFKLHCAAASIKGIEAALALKRMKGLPSATARRLYIATVAPVTDYASPIWSMRASESSLQLIRRVQRIGAQAVVRAYKTVSLEIAQAEASLPPVDERLHKQALRFWVNLHALEEQHPIRKEISQVDLNCKRYRSPFQLLATDFASTPLNRVETIAPFCIAPWKPKPQVQILDREQAIAFATHSGQATQCSSYYTDASARNGRVAVAFASRTASYAECIGSADHINEYIGELEAIRLALHEVALSPPEAVSNRAPIYIFSDSQSALKAIANPFRQSGQCVLRHILHLIAVISLCGRMISFHWVPSHSGIELNEAADSKAKELTRADAAEPPISAFSAKTTIYRRAICNLSHPTRADPKVGRFTKSVDRASPGNHIKALYDSLPASDIPILSRLRTGHCPLNGFLHSIDRADSEACTCGRRETIKHFLFNCSRWALQRRELRAETGPQCDNLSYLLGGWSGTGDVTTWKPTIDAIKAVIRFVKKTKRFDHNNDTN